MALVAAAVLAPARWVTARLPLPIGVHLLMGIWLVRPRPHPKIDVFTVHKESVAALPAGHDPNSPFYSSSVDRNAGFAARALCHYYILVTGTLCLALVASEGVSVEKPRSELVDELAFPALPRRAGDAT